ncbi:MAG: hypothetical protein K9L30_13940 [Desulfobacterales bacterium]|nr:hypothetical protein [Desulfobacterales bacterium]
MIELEVTECAVCPLQHCFIRGMLHDWCCYIDENIKVARYTIDGGEEAGSGFPPGCPLFKNSVSIKKKPEEK